MALELDREQYDRLLARMTVLADASAALSASLDYETTLATVSRLSLPVLADWCFTDVVMPDGRLRRLSVSHSSDPAMQQLLDDYQRDYPPRWDNASIPVRAMQRGEPIHAPHVAPESLRQMVASDEQWRRVLALRIGSVVAVPMRARGDTLGAMTFVRHPERPAFDHVDAETLSDLTQRGAQALDAARLYQAAQEANRAKDVFLAMLSHELRTPLNVILGYSRMLRSQAPAPELVTKIAGIVERNAMIQLRIVEDLLDVQRILRGHFHLQFTTFDLKDVVDSVMESLHLTAAAKGVHCAAHVEPVTVQADRARIQQVVWNVLSNAIKFTPHGGCVGVTGGRDDGHAVLHVVDSGEGIPQHFLPHVFEPFRQLDMSTTRRHLGVGMGLAIAKHIVEAHGGTISAASAGEGQGAAFRVRLPLRSEQTVDH